MFSEVEQNELKTRTEKEGDNRMTVGERIKIYLSEHGLKQNYIAERIGITNAKLNLSLNGNRKIPLDEYARICEVLGVPADTFLKSADELDVVEEKHGNREEIEKAK